MLPSVVQTFIFGLCFFKAFSRSCWVREFSSRTLPDQRLLEFDLLLRKNALAFSEERGKYAKGHLVICYPRTFHWFLPPHPQHTLLEYKRFSCISCWFQQIVNVYSFKNIFMCICVPGWAYVTVCMQELVGVKRECQIFWRELQMGMSYQWNWTQVLCQNIKCSSLLSHPLWLQPLILPLSSPECWSASCVPPYSVYVTLGPIHANVCNCQRCYSPSLHWVLFTGPFTFLQLIGNIHQDTWFRSRCGRSDVVAQYVKLFSIVVHIVS